jgi:DnaK suppressor protein
LPVKDYWAAGSIIALVPVQGRNYRRGNSLAGSHREYPGQQDARGFCFGGAFFMPTPFADDIDILVKAKRSIAGDYFPQDDEPYMSEAQTDYFRRLLQAWKQAIFHASADTLQQLQDGPIREPDLNDRASSETEWGIELRTRDRQRKLIAKIDSALRRIEEGEYGYCEVTGEQIGLGRLVARPIATMTVEAQEAHERREKVSRDD